MTTALVDRGISWQGPTPEHWTVGPMRRFLRQSKSLVGDAWSNTQLLSLTKRGVITRDPNSGEGKFPASFEGYQLVEPNDLVMCLFDIDETPRTIGRARQRGMVTGAYTRFSVDTTVADVRFIEWAFLAIDDGKRFRPLYTGLRKVIQKPRLLAAPLALPPLREQRAIADFLDRETALIDTLIEKQHALIEKLKERREAVVVRSVFGIRGPRRDIPRLNGRHLALEPLLAATPGHWGIERFKSCLERVELRNHDLSQPMMSLKVSGDVAPRAPMQQEPDEANLPKYLIARPDDLVVNPMWLTGGAIGVSNVSGAVSPDYRVFSIGRQHVPRYLHHLLRVRPYIDQYTLYTRAQTTFDRRVQQPQLDNLPVPVPPVNEQCQIVDHLDRETAKIDTLIEKVERHIELAQERRSALITAAVTGQIDVGA